MIILSLRHLNQMDMLLNYVTYKHNDTAQSHVSIIPYRSICYTTLSGTVFKHSIMKLLAIALVLYLCLIPKFCLAQSSVQNYLQENSSVVNTDEIDNSIGDAIAENDLVLFGYVHGSKLNQDVDLWLMKSLIAKGFRNIVVEMSSSYAYFMNKFIATGEDKYLDYVISNSYFWGTPQDASVEQRNKWIQLRAFLTERGLTDQISIIGIESQDDVDIVHLNDLVPAYPTGVAMVDSLQNHTTATRYRGSSYYIYDMEPIEKGQYEYSDYLVEPSIFSFAEKFKLEYANNPDEILKAFGENRAFVKAIFENINTSDAGREQVIFDNFVASCVDILQRNDKIYLSYGYTHVLQDVVSQNEYLGKKLSSSLGKEFSIASIVSELIASAYLDRRTFAEGESVVIKDITLNKKKFAGVKSYPSESKKELEFRGKKMLNKLNVKDDIVIYNLDGEDSPLRSSKLFIEPVRKAKKFNWIIPEDKFTTDYFQYLIRIRNSPPNAAVHTLDSDHS